METIEYASAVAIEPPSDGLRRTSLWLSGISSGVGLLVLASFAVTRVQVIAMVGVLWLYAGALLTFIAFVFGTIYATIAWRCGFPAPSTRWRAAVAVLMPFVTVGVAAACVILGAMLFDHYYSGFGDDSTRAASAPI